ncbi:toxin [Thermoactinomyces sp. DSM 45891]|uniref:hypothetical protein n=1 Tax=Thermoactinomyces sp. DSM 45891 TaxID=1761907 RepID=UPI00091CA8EE|nr:hypothetical protein [Thermoactinomyces sp. DSM 45891]SFX34688.1 toxin [Thermoactinomyces sp. DSM 45891]
MSIMLFSNLDSNDKYSFIYAVDQSVINSALQEASVFNAAIDPVTNQFDLNKAVQLVSHNSRAIVAAQLDQTVISNTIQIDTMVNQVMDILKNYLKVPFPEDQIAKALTVAMQNTFTNLKTQEESGWIFWKDTSSYNTTYLYNILFCIQYTQDILSIVPMGFEISVDVEKEKVLWFTVKDTHEFSVKLTALTEMVSIGWHHGH